MKALWFFMFNFEAEEESLSFDVSNLKQNPVGNKAQI